MFDCNVKESETGALAIRPKAELLLPPQPEARQASAFWRKFRAKAKLAAELAGANTLAFAAKHGHLPEQAT